MICDPEMCFFHFLQLWERISSLSSNFGTTSAIFEILGAKLVRIAPGLTKCPHIIHTCRYTDTSGHTEKLMQCKCLMPIMFR